MGNRGTHDRSMEVDADLPPLESSKEHMRLESSSVFSPHLSIDDFELLKVVGKGSFGKVFIFHMLAIYRALMRYYALIFYTSMCRSKILWTKNQDRTS